MSMTRVARLAEVTLPDFGRPTTTPETAVVAVRGAPRATAGAHGPARVRPARRVRRSRAQREPGLPDRLRSAVRGGDPGRRLDRRAGDPRRQRVLRDGRRGTAPDATPPLPGPQPAEPAARPLAAARRRSSATRASRPAHVSASSAGSRTPTGRCSISPRSSPTSSAGWQDRAASSRTPSTCSSTRPTVSGSSTRSISSRRWRRRRARRRAASGRVLDGHPTGACASAMRSPCWAGTARRCHVI